MSPEMPENPFAVAFDTATEATLHRLLYPRFLWRVEKLLWVTESNGGGGYKFESPDDDGYKFVAFNAGPRTCLGKELAYLQMKSVASAVLLRYRLSPEPGHRVAQKMSLTLFMKHGLRVMLEPRRLAAE